MNSRNMSTNEVNDFKVFLNSDENRRFDKEENRNIAVNSFIKKTEFDNMKKVGLKEHLKNLVKRANEKEALDVLDIWTNEKDNDLNNQVIQLMARYSRLQRDNNLGGMDTKDYKLEMARITNSLNALIDELPKDAVIEIAENATKPLTPKEDEKTATKISKPTIYFSYAWGDEGEVGDSREKIVQDLYDSLKTDGFKVIRDKEDVGYKGSITDFMKEIGKSDCIVVAISDKYLKSENCMFEMYEIFRNSKLEKEGFVEKIFPIRVESIALSQPKVLMAYFKHWEDKEKEWEELIEAYGKRIKPAQQEKYNRIKAIANELGDFLDFLSDMNTKTKAILSQNNFEAIKKAIQAQL